MTFAVAWILGGVTVRLRGEHSQLGNAAIISLVTVLGISMAIGAIVGGFKGMTRGFIVGTCVLAGGVLVGWLLSVTWMVMRDSLGVR